MFLENDAVIDLILRSVLLGPLALLWITLFVRFNGLGVFSKTTAFVESFARPTP